MADKFISASELWKILGIDPDGDCDNCSRWGRFGCESTEMQKVCLAIYECSDSEVRPVPEITDAVDEALCFLNSISNEIPYHVYSTLFDRIAEICPGADMREVEH